jgi:7-cyano-7-deazaguanine synthase in queuosine biosynthesis
MEILLYSGGLDSYIAWWYLGRPKTLYCRLGHRYEAKELEAVRRTIPETVIDDTLINLGRNWEEEDANIPARNLFLVLVAGMYGADKVWLVVQEGEMEIPDRSERFFEMATEVCSFLLGREVEVDTPFRHMTKVEMVGWYLKQGLPVEELLKTRSCYSGGEKPCGECGACFRRIMALKLNGLDEEMEVKIESSKIGKEYYRKWKEGKYTGKRGEEMKKFFEILGWEV